MAFWYEGISVAVGAVAVLFALLLALRGGRSLPTYLLLGWLLSLGLLYLVSGAGPWLGVPPVAMTWTIWVVSLPRPFLVIAFGLVYLRQVMDRRLQAVLGLLLLAVLTLAAAVIVRPSVFVSSDGASTSFAFNLWFTLSLLSYIVAVGILGFRWSVAKVGRYRSQLMWGLLPFLYWAVHDSIGLVGFPLFMGTRHSHLITWFSAHEPGWILLVSGATALLLVLLLMGAAWRRMISSGAEGRDAKVLFFAALYSVPLSMIQLFDPGLHLPVDALIVPVLAYGIVRHQVVDLDLQLKWTMSKGTVAGLVVATFFIVSETTKLFLEQAGLETWVGIAAAGLLLFAISPIQRVADRLSQTALPHAADRQEYRETRKSQIYRVALEELLADGRITPKERTALTRLRAHLDLDPRTATDLERQVQQWSKAAV